MSWSTQSNTALRSNSIIHEYYVALFSKLTASKTSDWASECPDVKNYKWRLNPVWHRLVKMCSVWQQWVSKG